LQGSMRVAADFGIAGGADLKFNVTGELIWPPVELIRDQQQIDGEHT
jgi:hypothetical protein